MYCRVIIVDDDPIVLNALRRELLRPPHIGVDGIEVETYSVPNEALDRLAQRDGNFDVAIVDYHMPEIDGVSFLDRLRSVHADTLRILLTGSINLDGAIAAINAARVDYLITKPWHEYDLKGRIALALHQRELLRQRTASLLSRPPEPNKAFRLLVVDDEVALRNAMVREISMHGHLTRGPLPLFEIDTAASAADALWLMDQGCFQLVISDYLMPGLDGIEFLYQVRERCPDTMRILMSGRSDLEVLKQAINVAGIYHFIGKPWEAAELRVLINDALNYRRLLLR